MSSYSLLAMIKHDTSMAVYRTPLKLDTSMAVYRTPLKHDTSMAVYRTPLKLDNNQFSTLQTLAKRQAPISAGYMFKLHDDDDSIAILSTVTL